MKKLGETGSPNKIFSPSLSWAPCAWEDCPGEQLELRTLHITMVASSSSSSSSWSPSWSSSSSLVKNSSTWHPAWTPPCLQFCPEFSRCSFLSNQHDEHDHNHCNHYVGHDDNGDYDDHDHHCDVHDDYDDTDDYGDDYYNNHDVIMIITIIMMTMIKVLIPAWSRLTEADSAMGWISVQQVWTLVAYIRFFVPYYFFI